MVDLTVDEIEEAFSDYDHLVANLLTSNYNNYPGHTRRLLAFLRKQEPFAGLCSRLCLQAVV